MKNKLTVLLAILITTLTACSSTVEFKEKTVKQITDRAAKKMHSWVTTEFTVKGVTNFDPQNTNETGIWILSSEPKTISSKSLNVYLAPQIVAEVKKRFNIHAMKDFIGKKIKVKGLAEPKFYCKARVACDGSEDPSRYYIQTQLKIEDINRISIL